VGRAHTRRFAPRRGGPQITDRDVDIITWIGRHGIVTVDQVSRAFFARADGKLGRWAAYRRLRKLRELRLIQQDRTHWRGPKVQRITGDGGRLVELDLMPAKLVLAEIAHCLAVVDLCQALLDENTGATITTEREIRVTRRREMAEGTREAGKGRIPDAVLTLPDGAVVAVELDRRPKRQRDIEQILVAYRQDRWNAIWWYAPQKSVARVRSVVESNRMEDLVSVVEWEIEEE